MYVFMDQFICIFRNMLIGMIQSSCDFSTRPPGELNSIRQQLDVGVSSVFICEQNDVVKRFVFCSLTNMLLI